MRKCENSAWSPLEAPPCEYVQSSYEDDESHFCPPGYKHILISSTQKAICVHISEPSVWRNVCMTDGAFTTFYELSKNEKKTVLTLLQTRAIDRVWMPAKRSMKFGPVVWFLGSDLNGEPVDFDDMGIGVGDVDHTVEHGCFSATVRSNLKTANVEICSKKLPILCVFREYAEKLIQLACPNKFFTVPFRGQQQQCYSGQHISEGNTSPARHLRTTLASAGRSRSQAFTSTTDIIGFGAGEKRKNGENPDLNPKTWVGENLMTINNSQKVTLVRKLAKQSGFSRNNHCLFAVSDGNVFVRDRSNWIDISKNVTYVNWGYPIRNGSHLTIDISGKWNWIDSRFNCMIVEHAIDLQTPMAVLNFDEAKSHLYLTVYGEEFLWRQTSNETGLKCFTNADYDLVRTVEVLRKKWSGILNADESFSLGSNDDQPRTISKAIYELKLYGDGPGYYWCRGFAIPDFRPIDTPKIVAHRRSRVDVFATLINTACDNCEKLILKKSVRTLAREFRDHLRHLHRNVKIDIENVRVMQVDDIHPKVFARILFHVSVSTALEFDDSENLLRIPPDSFRIFKIKQIMEEALSTAKSLKYAFVSLNSTEFCLPDSMKSTDKHLNWNSTKIGKVIAPRELCLLSNGLPVLRQCVGDFLYGGVWRNLTRQQCHSNVSDITRQLYQLDRTLSQSNETHGVIASLGQLFHHSNSEKFVPADLFYLGRLMHTIHQLSDNSTTTATMSSRVSPSFRLNNTDAESIFSIYNSLMYLNENITRISAALNSTNILLDAFDNIINGLSPDPTSSVRNNLIVNFDDGTIAAQTQKLIVYVIDPFVSNVSGIALIKRTMLDGVHGERDDFTDYTIRLIYANQSLTDLLAEPNIEIAAFVPQNLLDRLNETKTSDNDTATGYSSSGIGDKQQTSPKMERDVRIVISVYYNDLLFQEYKNVTHAKSAGKIISVSIPGYGPNLPALVPIYVKAHNYTTENTKICGYWNFQNTNNWSDDGCEYGGMSNKTDGSDPVVLCACSHLTHFSYLVLGTYVHSIRNDDEVVIIEAHHVALDMITLLGCSLSLLGIFGIAITALAFRSWREKPSSKVLLQLSGAVGLQMILLCFVNTENSAIQLALEEKWWACIALGAMLQYSILVAFAWMLITAYLQFMRYVKVLGQMRASRFFLKSFFIGWIVPLIPVLLVIIIAPNSYTQSIQTTNSGICYPSNMALYLGVILPIGIIVLANLIIFLLVIYNILYGPSGKLRSHERDLTLSQLRLSVFLFFLLGLTWIFGFLASTKAGLIFSYLFCLTATIQGFVLFVYFIILDPGTRKLWRNLIAQHICFLCYGKVEYYK